LRSYQNTPPPSSPLNWLQISIAVVLGVTIGTVICDVKRRETFAQQSQTLAQDIMRLPDRAASMISGKGEKISSLPGRVNILLMGVDSNGRNTQRFLNTRSDTMMLVSLDPDAQKVGIVSIPRDSRVKLADGHGTDKINSAHALGGPELAVKTVEEAFDVHIDHYVAIDVQGLRKVFHVLGPADILIEKKMRYTDHAGGLHVNLEPGMHTLTPEQMEEYVRFRHDARGDIGRIDRQQWFMRAITQKLKEPTVIFKLPELFKLADEYVETDMKFEDMVRIAAFGKDIVPSQVETAMLPGKATSIHGGSYWLPDPTGAAIVFNRLLGTNLTAADITLGQSSDRDEPTAGAADVAYAAELDERDKATQAKSANDLSITLKYPRGGEKIASKLEKALALEGYKVKYKYRVDAADCTHEQIVENSYNVDENAITELQKKIGCIKSWPVVLKLESRTNSDLTLIISPSTVASIAEKLP
jgi:LCP family protein required for cell wall assembly